jgi:hypothetical protein
MASTENTSEYEPLRDTVRRAQVAHIGSAAFDTVHQRIRNLPNGLGFLSLATFSDTGDIARPTLIACASSNVSGAGRRTAWASFRGIPPCNFLNLSIVTAGDGSVVRDSPKQLGCMFKIRSHSPEEATTSTEVGHNNARFGGYSARGLSLIEGIAINSGELSFDNLTGVEIDDPGSVERLRRDVAAAFVWLATNTGKIATER